MIYTTRDTTRQTLNLLRIKGVSFPIARADAPLGEELSFIPVDHFIQSHHRPLVPRRKDVIGIPGSTSELDQTTGKDPVVVI